jgi:hypothetical protein
VLSPTSSPPARDARVSRFPDDAAPSARASDPDAETAETTRVLMEAKAALEARALALAEETARANARVAKLEADVAEHARVLELERTELRKERDAHDATRNALRTNAMAASRREAALTFSLDVQKQKSAKEKKSAIAQIPADILTDTRAQTRSDARVVAKERKEKEKEKGVRENRGDDATTQTETDFFAIGRTQTRTTTSSYERFGAEPVEREPTKTRGSHVADAVASRKLDERPATTAETDDGEERETLATVKNTVVKNTVVKTLAVELAGVRRAHAAATQTSASLRAALDAAEARVATLELETERNRAATIAGCARDAVRAAATDALESLLEDAAADAARFRKAFEAAQADARRLEGAAAARDAAEAGREKERRKRADAEAALAEARAVAREALAREPARAGEARGHASAREDALRARDAALERAATLETLLEAERARAAEAGAAAAASETARDVADGRAREAEGRAARAETLADALEADLKTSSADSANRVAGLESDLATALAASGAARRELASARAAVRAAADAAEARARGARAERDALAERVASAVAERDGSVRDAEETRRSREEATRALETMTRIADAHRARLEEVSDAAATVFAARAFALSAFFSMQRLELRTAAETARDDARVAESRAEGLRDETRVLKADVGRLEAKAASLETALRETSSVTERVAVRCASLAEEAKKGEEAERVSRLRVAYARECERRLAVAAAEKIRLARALDALGGEEALETRRAAAG